MKHALLMGLIVLLGLSSCDSSDTDDGALGARYALRIVNTTSGNLSYMIGNRWCYDGEACPIPAGIDSGGGVVFPNQSSIRSVSQDGRNATGKAVRINVEEGDGRIEIMRGTLNSQWSDDFQGTVIHSAPLGGVGTVTFQWAP